MRIVRQLHESLNRIVATDIKQRRTNGFAYIDSRDVLCGSEHAFRLPIGLAAGDVVRHADALTASVGAPVEVIDRGGAVVIRVVAKYWPAQLRFDSSHLRDDSIIIGYNRLLQPVYHPLNTHLLVGGASKSGKTDWLRWIVYQLVRQRYLVYIADLKGISFFPFESVPAVTVYSDLREAHGMLNLLVAELERRKQIIKSTRNRALSARFQRVAFIGDEGAVFSPAQHTGYMKQIAYECEAAIAYLGQQAREFQMFGIMCYQRPDEKTINKQFKANVEASIAFRTKDATNSRIILDRDGAEKISPTTPGRCIYSFDRDHMLQVPFVGDDAAWEKLLTPSRTEVLTSGRSQRTESPGIHLEGSFAGADRDDTATRDTEPISRSGQTSERGIAGLGAGRIGLLAASRQGKGVEPYPVRSKAHAMYSDEVD